MLTKKRVWVVAFNTMFSKYVAPPFFTKGASSKYYALSDLHLVALKKRSFEWVVEGVCLEIIHCCRKCHEAYPP